MRILALFLSLSLCACSRSGSPYVPERKPESELRYRGTIEYFLGKQGIEVIDRVSEGETLNGVSYDKHIVEYIGVPGFEKEVTWTRMDEKGVHTVDAFHWHFGEYVEMPFPVDIDTAWTVRQGDSSTRFKAMAIETVDTPAKRYENCLKVHATHQEPSGRSEADRWYAAGVGLVKVRLTMEGGILEYALEKEP